MTSAPVPHHDSGNLRVSDADRDLVMQVLNTAYAEGRITHDELDERGDQVLRSKTFNDLRPLTADLMPSRITEQYVTRPQARADQLEQVQVSGERSNGHDSISAILSSRKRTDAWSMAARTSVAAVMGDVKLDLRGGVMQHKDCVIDLAVIMGDVKLFVPDGVIVIDQSHSIMADTSIKGLRPAAVGAPTITLTGFVMMGDVKVYGPDHQSWGKRLGLTQ